MLKFTLSAIRNKFQTIIELWVQGGVRGCKEVQFSRCPYEVRTHVQMNYENFSDTSRKARHKNKIEKDFNL